MTARRGAEEGGSGRGCAPKAGIGEPGTPHYKMTLVLELRSVEEAQFETARAAFARHLCSSRRLETALKALDRSSAAPAAAQKRNKRTSTPPGGGGRRSAY